MGILPRDPGLAGPPPRFLGLPPSLFPSLAPFPLPVASKAVNVVRRRLLRGKLPTRYRLSGVRSVGNFPCDTGPAVLNPWESSHVILAWPDPPSFPRVSPPSFPPSRSSPRIYAQSNGLASVSGTMASYQSRMEPRNDVDRHRERGEYCDLRLTPGARCKRTIYPFPDALFLAAKDPSLDSAWYSSVQAFPCQNSTSGSRNLPIY